MVQSGKVYRILRTNKLRLEHNQQNVDFVNAGSSSIAALAQSIVGDGPEEDWDTFKEPNYISCVGEIFVACYGFDRWAVCIAELDCGFYAYLPLTQHLLFRLYFWTAILERMAVSLAAKIGTIQTQAEAENLRDKLKAFCDKEGITANIKYARDQARAVNSAFYSLALLKPVKDYRKRMIEDSNLRISTSKQILDNALIAVGEPHSIERHLQMEILAEQPLTEKVPFPARHPVGSAGWQIWLESRIEGTALYASAKAYQHRLQISCAIVPRPLLQYCFAGI